MGQRAQLHTTYFHWHTHIIQCVVFFFVYLVYFAIHMYAYNHANLSLRSSTNESLSAVKRVVSKESKDNSLNTAS